MEKIIRVHLRSEQSQPDKLCSSILEIDPKVRYAAVYVRHDEFVCEYIREGLTPLLDKEQTYRSFQQAIMRWSSRQLLRKQLGPAKYAMAEYEKVKRYTFYLDVHLILGVTTDVDVNGKTLEKILELISVYTKEHDEV